MPAEHSCVVYITAEYCIPKMDYVSHLIIMFLHFTISLIWHKLTSLWTSVFTMGNWVSSETHVYVF